jgi:YidC/Oxa1 family membrane protein insertase
LHGFIQNWGWSIVALVVLLKIAFYWLNAKAYASMAKMKAVNPKITEMRERLKDNPQQMQQEMMRIYREEKVNPMGGCFPIMVQIPVFIALYWVLLSSVEMRNAPWVLWIHDLSSPDPYYILPLVMTATTLLQTALNPTPPDPMQAKMMWFMPLIFSVMFFFFPAGLVLVLDYQQHVVHCPAVDHQHPHGCAAAVQSAEVWLSREALRAAHTSAAGPSTLAIRPMLEPQQRSHRRHCDGAWGGGGGHCAHQWQKSGAVCAAPAGAGAASPRGDLPAVFATQQG